MESGILEVPEEKLEKYENIKFKKTWEIPLRGRENEVWRKTKFFAGVEQKKRTRELWKTVVNGLCKKR